MRHSDETANGFEPRGRVNKHGSCAAQRREKKKKKDENMLRNHPYLAGSSPHLVTKGRLNPADVQLKTRRANAERSEFKTRDSCLCQKRRR